MMARITIGTIINTIAFGRERRKRLEKEKKTQKGGRSASCKCSEPRRANGGGNYDLLKVKKKIIRSGKQSWMDR
jgi:hypothetical protein